MSSGSVAVLFARADSVYKSIPVCDVFDLERDALTFAGGVPVIAHPPCRGWGRLRKLSRHTESELTLGVWAVQQVRMFGGVLEHPEASCLFAATGMPRPGCRDSFGGWTLPVLQKWWGHRAEKATWFYIVGVPPSDVPLMPLVLGRAPRCITNTHGVRAGHPNFRSEVTKAEREATPPLLAQWLVDLAFRVRPAVVQGSKL